MHLSAKTIADIERKYRRPEVFHLRQAIIDVEFDLLMRCMNRGRAHDVTPFISTGSGGLAYRVALTDRVVDLLDRGSAAGSQNTE